MKIKKSISKIVKELDEAKGNVEKAKQFERDGKSDKALKEYDAAIKKFTAILKSSDEDSIKEFLQQAYIAKGDLLKKIGITKEAMACYELAAQSGSAEAKERLQGISAPPVPTLNASAPNIGGTGSASTSVSPRANSNISTGITNPFSKWAKPNRSKSSNDVTSQANTNATLQPTQNSLSAATPTPPQTQPVSVAPSSGQRSKTPPPTRSSNTTTPQSSQSSQPSSMAVPPSTPPRGASPSLGSRLKPTQPSNKTTSQQSPAIFKSNPKPVEVKFKFDPDVKIESTAHLAWLLSMEKDKDSQHYQNWLSLAMDILNLFAKQPVKQRPEIEEVLALAEIDDEELSNNLLEVFITPIKNGTLIKPSILNGLADVINHVNPALINTDDFIQIFRVLNERLQITHGQGSAKKLEHLIRALSRLMTAMVDAGIKGLARKQEHQPLYDCLRGFRSHQNRRIAFDTDLCLQALARLPNDESNLGSFLRRAYHVTKGASHLASAVLNISPNELFEVLAEFRKAANVQLTFKNHWYEDFRYAQFLIRWNHFVAFEEFLKGKEFKQVEDLYFGILYILKEVVETHYDDDARLKALEFLKSLFNNDDLVKFESVRQEIINVLVDFIRQGDPQIAQVARSHIKSLLNSAHTTDEALIQSVLPDLTSIISKSHKAQKPVRNSLLVAIQDPTNATLADKLASLDRLFTQGMELDLPKTVEKKCQLLRERFLSDQDIKDELATYIPIQAAYKVTDKETFDMETKAREFIRSPMRQLLLIGNAGGGKSTFNRYLLTQLWTEYQSGGIIPIFVSLPVTTDPIHCLMKEALTEAGFTAKEIDFLKDNRELVVVLDGYDEVTHNGVGLTTNLYATNKLSEWKNISVLLSCRTQYTTAHKNYTTFFVPTAGAKVQNNLFQEVTVVPFSESQIKAYIAKYLELHKDAAWSSPGEWLSQIDSIPGMQELIETPFLLMLTMEVLPEIAKKYRELEGPKRVKMMQADLYDAFMENWFQREEDKLVVKGQLPADGHDIKDDYWEFAKTLGSAMHEAKVCQVYYAPTRSLFSNNRASGVNSPWAMFFSSDPNMVAARKACPLRKVGPQQWAFIHATFVNYFHNKLMHDAKSGKYDDDLIISDDDEDSNQFQKKK